MSLRTVGIGVVGVALFATGLWAGIGSAGWLNTDATAIGLKATLSPAREVPTPTGVSAGARGSFSAGLTRTGTGGRLSWRVTFRGLTGRAIAAHIHLAKPGKAGPVAVPLCGPCRSGVRKTARVNARTLRALLNGGAYTNVHTAKNPAGEMRGQIRRGGAEVPPLTTTSTTTETTTTTTTVPYP